MLAAVAKIRGGYSGEYEELRIIGFQSLSAQEKTSFETYAANPHQAPEPTQAIQSLNNGIVEEALSRTIISSGIDTSAVKKLMAEQSMRDYKAAHNPSSKIEVTDESSARRKAVQKLTKEEIMAIGPTAYCAHPEAAKKVLEILAKHTYEVLATHKLLEKYAKSHPTQESYVEYFVQDKANELEGMNGKKQ